MNEVYVVSHGNERTVVYSLLGHYILRLSVRRKILLKKISSQYML